MNKKDYRQLQPGDKVRLHKTFTATRILDDSGYTWNSLAPGDSLAERLSGKTVTVRRLDDKKRGLLVIDTDDDSWFITRRLIRAKVEPESANAPALSYAVPPDGYRLLSDDEVIERGDLWWNAHIDAVWEPASGVIGRTLGELRAVHDQARQAQFVNRSACRKIPADDPRSNEWRDMEPDEVFREGDSYITASGHWGTVYGLAGTRVCQTNAGRGRRRVRRYAPDPSYRYLDDDEVIVESDRFAFGPNPTADTPLRAPSDWMGSSIDPIVGETPEAVREACPRWFSNFFAVREHPG